jgi:hypothetical protein
MNLIRIKLTEEIYDHADKAFHRSLANGSAAYRKVVEDPDRQKDIFKNYLISSLLISYFGVGKVRFVDKLYNQKSQYRRRFISVDGEDIYCRFAIQKNWPLTNETKILINVDKYNELFKFHIKKIMFGFLDTERNVLSIGYIKLTDIPLMAILRKNGEQIGKITVTGDTFELQACFLSNDEELQ